MLHPFPLVVKPSLSRRFSMAGCGRPARALRLASGCLAMALLAACASDYDTSRYHTSRENTQADAHRQAQGKRGALAPSQLQFGFGESERKRADQAEPAADSQAQGEALPTEESGAVPPKPLRQPQTFLGTMPCLTADRDCPASRVTLTFAPEGEWRARSVMLGHSSQQPLVQQGCWEVVHREPLRVILRTVNDNSRAAFDFINDGLLRLHRFNDVSPRLDYHLTRQPDLDPIDELANEPALNCRAN